MSDRGDDRTVAFGRGGGAPPNATAPLYLPGEQPPGRGRQALLYLLVALLGLAGGFAAAQFIGPADDDLPDGDLVFYENAAMSFPIVDAAFTSSTYDAGSRTCDKQLLKQSLRSDPHRFAAWLDLQEISESDFDAFVDALETRILEEATPVTNHGCFAEGEGECPFAIQSVLGPGTPVWFHPGEGRIVAKCTCSNPIRDPKCPPNCEEIPTPTPSPSPTPTPTQTAPPSTPPPTQPPTPTPTLAPTPSPTQPPTPTPIPTQSATVP